MRQRCWELSLLAVCVVGPWARADEKELSWENVRKRGMAVVARIESEKDTERGSATCVHPTGLFVTTAQSLPTDSTQFKLNFDLNAKQSRTLPATIVRVDNDLDLALLRVQGVSDLVAAKIAPRDEVDELQELLALHFRVNYDKAPKRTMLADVMTAVSIERRGGVVDRIVTETPVGTSSLGCPLLNRHAELVGIFAGRPGNVSRKAIPASHLIRFLSQPTVAFVAPKIDAENLYQPRRFSAQAISSLPSKNPLEVKLFIKNSRGPEREYAMKLVGDSYEVEAVAALRPMGKAILKASVGFAGSRMLGEVEDLAIRLGGNEVFLSQLRRIDLVSRRVTFVDGRIVDAKIDDFDALTMRIGGDELKVKLTGAQTATFEPAIQFETAAFRIVVSQDGKEVARVNQGVTIDLSPPVLEVPPTRLERQLPAPISQIAIGGGGRFIIMTLPRIGKLAIFDVNQARVVKYLDLAEDDARIAAGRSMIAVALPKAKEIQRWSLATFEREASAPFSHRPAGSITPAGIDGIAMGSASDGPLLITATGDSLISFFDLFEMKKIAMATTASRELRYRSGDSICASPNGRGFAIGGNVVALRDSTWELVVSESNIKSKKSVDSHQENHEVFDEGSVVARRLPRMLSIPALHGQLRLDVSPPGSIGLRVPGGGPGTELPKSIQFPDDMQNRTHDGLFFFQRLLLVPEAKMLIVIPGSGDRLNIYPFDVESHLRFAGAEYLFVASTAPAATRGEEYTYPIAVKSNLGKQFFRLDSGPEGMTVAEDGRVTWRVPKNYERPNADAVVSIRAGDGRKLTYSFTIGISKADSSRPKLAPAAMPSALSTLAARKTPTPKPPILDLPKTTIPFAGPVSQWCSGGGGRYHVFHVPQGKHALIFDAKASAIVAKLAVADNSALMAANNDSLFILDSKANELQRFRLADGGRDGVSTLSMPPPFFHLVVGSASPAPLLLVANKGVYFVDPDSLRATRIRESHFNRSTQMRISGEGTLLTASRSQTQYEFFIVSDEGLQPRPLHIAGLEPGQQSLWYVLTPGPLGHYLYGNRGLLTATGRSLVATKHAAGRLAIPAADTENFYLVLQWTAEREKESLATIDLHDVKNQACLATLGVVALPKEQDPSSANSPDRCCLLIPSAKLLLTLPAGKNCLELTNIDPYDLLAKSGQDYLHFASRPPVEAIRGTELRYTPTIRSNVGNTKLALRYGPPGMSIANDATLVWSVPRDFRPSAAEIILALEGADGNETVEHIRLPIRNPR